MGITLVPSSYLKSFTVKSILKVLLIFDILQFCGCFIRLIPFFKVLVSGSENGNELWYSKMYIGKLGTLLIIQVPIIWHLYKAMRNMSTVHLKKNLTLAIFAFFYAYAFFLCAELGGMDTNNMMPSYINLATGNATYLANLLKIYTQFNCYFRMRDEGAQILEDLRDQVNAETDEFDEIKDEGPQVLPEHIISFTAVEIGQAIGQGNSGIVFKGTWSKSKTESVPVAIKMLKQCHSSFTLSMVVKEVRVMIHAGNHKNVAQFYGMTSTLQTQDLSSLLIISELCDGGSLLSRLHHLPDQPSYINLENQTELDRYAHEILEGMVYLASRKIIHGDLAARNILLTTDMRVKISDFGLARKLYNYQMYLALVGDACAVEIPWKWSSIEVLEDLKFSEASDVWAYGVLLWEIYTLGKEPYEDESWSSNFTQKLREGCVLGKPDLSDQGRYHLMLQCWNLDWKKRPTFKDLKKVLGYAIS